MHKNNNFYGPRRSDLLENHHSSLENGPKAPIASQKIVESKINYNLNDSKSIHIITNLSDLKRKKQAHSSKRSIKQRKSNEKTASEIRSSLHTVDSTQQWRDQPDSSIDIRPICELATPSIHIDDSVVNCHFTDFILKDDLDWTYFNDTFINTTQSEKDHFERSYSATSDQDKALREKHLLTSDSIIESILAKDIELFNQYPEVEPNLINSLLKFALKYDCFKKLFQRSTATTDTPYDRLKRIGFNLSQLINILKPEGGNRNLEVLRKSIEDHTLDKLLACDANGKPTLFKPEQLVQVLANEGGWLNFQALLDLLPLYLAFEPSEREQCFKLLCKNGASARIHLAKKLIDKYPTINKCNLFIFLKKASNKSVENFESLSLEELAEKISPKALVHKHPTIDNPNVFIFHKNKPNIAVKHFEISSSNDLKTVTHKYSTIDNSNIFIFHKDEPNTSVKDCKTLPFKKLTQKFSLTTARPKASAVASLTNTTTPLEPV